MLKWFSQQRAQRLKKRNVDHKSERKRKIYDTMQLKKVQLSFEVVVAFENQQTVNV